MFDVVTRERTSSSGWVSAARRTRVCPCLAAQRAPTDVLFLCPSVGEYHLPQFPHRSSVLHLQYRRRRARSVALLRIARVLVCTSPSLRTARRCRCAYTDGAALHPCPTSLLCLPHASPPLLPSPSSSCPHRIQLHSLLLFIRSFPGILCPPFPPHRLTHASPAL